MARDGPYPYEYIYTDTTESWCVRYAVSIRVYGGEWKIKDCSVEAVNGRPPTPEESVRWYLAFHASLWRDCHEEIVRESFEVFGPREPLAFGG